MEITSYELGVTTTEINNYSLLYNLKDGNVWVIWKKWNTFKKCLLVTCICLIVIILIMGIYLGMISRRRLNEKRETVLESIIANVDSSINPCDNFYEYVCRRWIEKHPLPNRFIYWTLYRELEEANLLILKHYLEKPLDEMKSQAEEKAKIYYDSCNENIYTMDRLNLPDVKHLLKKLGGWSFDQDFNKIEWSLEKTLLKIVDNIDNSGPLFWWSIQSDLNNNTQNFIHIQPGALALSPDHYLDGNKYTEELQEYMDIMEKIGVLLGADPSLIQQHMMQVLKFETELAKIQNSSDSEKVSLEDFQNIAPFISWTRYFQHTFEKLNKTIDKETIIVNIGPEYFRQLNKLIENSDKETINNYLIWQSIISLPALELVKLQGKHSNSKRVHLKKTSNRQEWSRRCVKEINYYMKFVTGAIYVREAFDENTILMVEEIINEVQRGFIKELNDLDWIDNETKKVLTRKAEEMQYLIAHPDFIRDQQKLNQHYIDVNFEENNYLVNNLRARQFLMKKNLQENIEESVWDEPITTANAFYALTKNQIILPVGVLQKPFIDMESPKSLNFALLGGIIGHEITHGFDDSGSGFDSKGNPNDLWSPETRTKFLNKTECLERQYNKYVVEGRNIDGFLTLGENIADNGGLRAAYNAYLNTRKTSKDLHPRPDINFNHKQLFFIAYAQEACGTTNKENVLEFMNKNEHAPNEYRVIGALSNFEEFSKEFNCPNGSRMNPIEKCRLW